MKKILMPLIVVCIGLMISVIMIELILRIFSLVPTQSLRAVNQNEFDSIPGVYAPNQSFVSDKVPQLPHKVTINGLGYRGEDFPRRKPTNELRVFLTGDSFAFGDLVNDDQTLPYRLQMSLQKQCSNIRIINAGLAGSTIVGQTVVIERGLEIEPDIVILVFHENDLIDLKTPNWYRLEKNRAIKSKFPFTILLPVIQNTAVWNFALKLRARYMVRQIVSSDGNSPEAGSAELQWLDQIKKEYLSKLAAIREKLQSKDTDLLFVIFPGSNNLEPPVSKQAHDTGRVEWGDSGILLWAERSVARLGIPTLNLQSAIRHGFPNTNNGYLLPYDGHPSAAGYDVAARALSEFPPFLNALSMKCSPLIDPL